MYKKTDIALTIPLEYGDSKARKQRPHRDFMTNRMAMGQAPPTQLTRARAAINLHRLLGGDEEVAEALGLGHLWRTYRDLP